VAEVFTVNQESPGEQQVRYYLGDFKKSVEAQLRSDKALQKGALLRKFTLSVGRDIQQRHDFEESLR
jgi:hypothetical protein